MAFLAAYESVRVRAVLRKQHEAIDQLMALLVRREGEMQRAGMRPRADVCAFALRGDMGCGAGGVRDDPDDRWRLPGGGVMGALLNPLLSPAWIQCASCKMDFAVVFDFQVEMQQTRETFFCPRGHQNWYPGKTATQLELERVQFELKRAREERDNADRIAAFRAAEADTARKQEKKAKKALKDQTKRIEAGVCPHCTRTFKQLAAHMRCKHADILATCAPVKPKRKARAVSR